jgi:hypothetical protein
MLASTRHSLAVSARGAHRAIFSLSLAQNYPLETVSTCVLA